MLPDSDVLMTNWTAIGDSSGYLCIDEGVATSDDETTYITGLTNGSWAKFSIAAPPEGDPTSLDGHLVAIRFRWTSSGNKGYQFQLVQQSGDIVIANKTANHNKTTYVGRTIEMTTGEAGNITDYSSLELWVKKDTASAGALRVTGFELRVPTPAAADEAILLGHPF
jgi:hypothetical protein